MQSRKGYPLHVHLVTLFGSLAFVVGLLTCGVNFVMTKSTLEAAAAEATRRISRETFDEVEELITPAQMAVKLISHSALVDAQSLDQRLAKLALVRDALETSPILQSIYVGYSDGSFFYVRSLRSDSERQIFQAPPLASYVVRSVERNNGVVTGRLHFADRELSPVGSVDDSEFADRFDVRQRSWFTRAIATDELVLTDAYLFFSDQEVGATLSISTPDRRAVVGGDFRLDTLGQLLAGKETTAGSMLALLESNGKLIAVDRKPPESSSAPDVIGADLLSSAADYDIPILTYLAGRVQDNEGVSGGNEQVSVNGEVWYTNIDRLSPSNGKTIFLASAIPQAELLKDARQRAWVGLLITAAVTLLAIPLIWFAARYISRPLQALANEVAAVRRFEFSAPVVMRSGVREVNGLGVAIEEMRHTIERFLTIVKTTSAETRLENLVPLLLRETLDAAGAHAGVMYLVDGDSVKAVAAINRSGAETPHGLARMSRHDLPPLLRAATVELVPRTGGLSPENIRLMGLGALEQNPPAQAVVIPLVGQQNELLGVIVALRATPIEPAQLAFVGTLVDLCAGGVEVRVLTQERRALFEAFIRLVAGAIDAKSAHTGGHCERVPELAKMLAQAACDTKEGPYSPFQMTDEEWESLHVAAWLHDCGKVTTPEYIIDKATKLETLFDRIHEVRMRFEVLKRDAEIAYLRALVDGEDAESARGRRDAELADLDEDFAFVAQCNRGGEYMNAADQARLVRIASRSWLRTIDDRLGISDEEQLRSSRAPAKELPVLEPLLADKPEHEVKRSARDTIPAENPWGFKLNTPEHLYNRGELHNLTVARGTLSREERFKIEDHIVQTQIMLSRLPFPKHLREVPEIAGSHHEKMDGTGYPRRLTRDQMSPLARMMAIADVFEALTAADRPYKRAKTLSESLRIMAIAKEQHHIDPDLFDLFLTSGVYLKYARRFLRPEQIDEVDIKKYVGDQG